MKNLRRSLLLLVTSFGLACSAQTPAAPADKPAITPAPSVPAAAVAPAASDASAASPKTGNTTFFKKHASFLERGKSGPIGVLFLGDSITEGWANAPHIWERYYGKYQPANFGIGGDRTQHVIWRIENGELDGLTPKVVVLMLGTNNSLDNTGAEIAAADTKIVHLIREKIPGAKVLLLAIFPRGPRKGSAGKEEPWGKIMGAINSANAELAKLDDGRNVRFLDINAHFLGNDGTIPKIIMPDQLHPNAAGYQLWAEAMQRLLDEMLN